MRNQRRIRFSDLGTSDLLVDALYESGSYGDVRDDPLAPLLGVGNQGGFRYLGSSSPFKIRHCILYSSLIDIDWPDRLDAESGIFVYYGDNKSPGHELHETTRKGNLILREMFLRIHVGKRDQIPPVFVFTKGPNGREVIFRGLAVPGAAGVSQADDLVAVWKTKAEQRFQNYRAIFTILDVAKIPRAWISDLQAGLNSVRHAPERWLEWRTAGVYTPLLAPPAREHRSPREQLPSTTSDLGLLQQIVDYYGGHPEGAYAFERCAAELFRLMQPSVRTLDLTRPWRDGGRDALGVCGIGVPPSAIGVEFALEAKCKNPSTSNSSGVRETARLIARIRHRQFGVFVTTSCIGSQAYQELVEDAQPIIVMAGVDIVRVLKENDLATQSSLKSWLLGLEEKAT